MVAGRTFGLELLGTLEIDGHGQFRISQSRENVKSME